MAIRLEIFPDRGLDVNGARISHWVAPDVLYDLLGQPDRVFTGEKSAPVGHQNNHVHVYDRFGLCLLDHYHTRLIGAVMCLYDPSRLPGMPRLPFEGELSIEGHQIGRELRVSDLAEMGFAKQLGVSLVREGKVCSVNVLLATTGRLSVHLTKVAMVGISLREVGS